MLSLLAVAGCTSFAPAPGDVLDPGPALQPDAGSERTDGGTALPEGGIAEPDVLHVSAQGTDLGADGSRARPFRSLAVALSFAGTARAAGAEIHVCQGDYEEARLVVRTPLRIEGSFDCNTWTRGNNPEVSESVVRGVDPAMGALLDIAVADGVPVRVERLALLGADNATTPGATTVRTIGSAVVLQHLRLVSPVGASVQAALLSGGALMHSSLTTRSGSAVGHYGSGGLTVTAHAVRVEDVAVSVVRGARCVGLMLGAGVELELRSSRFTLEGCTYESLLVGGAAASFDSRDSVFYARSPQVQATLHGLNLRVSRVRSLSDRVIAEIVAPAPTTKILGAVIDSPDAELDNLVLALSSTRAIGMSIANTVRVRHATVALLGTGTGSGIEFPDKAPGPRAVESSLVLCLACSADSSTRQAFAWPTSEQVRNNVTRGFTRDSISTDATRVESFATWSPSNVALPCADGACAGTVVLPELRQISTAGLPLADTVPCAIATRPGVLLEPAFDAVGAPRSTPASAGAHERDGACAP